jgi:hypothetical protein
MPGICTLPCPCFWRPSQPCSNGRISTCAGCTGFCSPLSSSAPGWILTFFPLPVTITRTSFSIRGIIAYYNLHHSGSAVLLTDESAIAGLQGDIYMNHWHQFPTMDQIRKAATLPEMSQLLESWKIEYFISPIPEPGHQVQPPVLRALLDACTAPEYEFGNYYLARLDGDCSRRGWVPSATAPPAIVVPPRSP